ADTKYDNPGQRVFELYAEGQRVVDNLDIIAAVGKNAALEKTLSNIEISDGILDLYFKPKIDLPTLSGVKITRLVSTGVQMKTTPPHQFGLNVFPNPFNPTVKIEYSLDRAGHVDIALFNSNGQAVKNVLNANRPAGTHILSLEANDLSAGVYFVRLLLDGQMVATKKTTYLK
ncbi:MAG: T9SS type A sorting domain-containing protein, partial [bacterium]